MWRALETMTSPWDISGNSCCALFGCFLLYSFKVADVTSSLGGLRISVRQRLLVFLTELNCHVRCLYLTKMSSSEKPSSVERIGAGFRNVQKYTRRSV